MTGKKLRDKKRAEFISAPVPVITENYLSITKTILSLQWLHKTFLFLFQKDRGDPVL